MRNETPRCPICGRNLWTVIGMDFYTCFLDLPTPHPRGIYFKPYDSTAYQKENICPECYDGLGKVS